MGKPTRLRPGTTLIETLVALALLVGLLAMLHTLGKAALKYPATDSQQQAALVFNQALQQEAASAMRMGVSTNGEELTLVYATKAGEQSFLVEEYPKKIGVRSMIRLTKLVKINNQLTKQGHEPMLDWAYALRFEAHVGYVVYHFTMGAQGLQYTGVILGETNKR